MDLVAQVVLRLVDGTSILDAKDPLTSDNIVNYFVDIDRIEESKNKLEKYGFTISSQDRFTLSVTGSYQLFSEVFGIDESMMSGTISDIHAVTIPPDLNNLIADVIIPKPPDYF